MTKRYAVMGHPIAHSLSPRIHAAFAKQLKIDLSYEAIEAPKERFLHQLTDFYSTGGLGLNVTMPLKVAAYTLARRRDSAAERAGAVNTLIRREDDDGWDGANTDGIGLIADLKRLEIALRGKKILILGAGGAAQGILGPLLDNKPEMLVIANRSRERAENMGKRLPDVRLMIFDYEELQSLGSFDLVLNCTAIGHEHSRMPWGDEIIGEHTIAYDLSYGEAAEPFRNWASNQGALAAHDGLGMLVEQAAASFALWHGKTPKTEKVLADLGKLNHTRPPPSQFTQRRKATDDFP